jgi:hypothetical protein
MPRDPRYVFFYEVSKRLRAELPVSRKVHVRLKTGYGSYGTCQYMDGDDPRFDIIIRKTGSAEQDVHVLLHEYAHVLSWFCETAHHGTAWQTAYGRVYRWYEKEVLEEDVIDDALVT